MLQDFFGQTTNYESTKIKNKLKQTSAEALRDKFVEGDAEAISFFNELLRDLEDIDQEVSDYFVYANSQIEEAMQRFVVKRTAMENQDGDIEYVDNLVGRVRGKITHQDLENVNSKKSDRSSTYYITNREIAEEIAWSDKQYLEKLSEVDQIRYYHAILKWRDEEMLDYLPFVLYEDGDLYFENPPKMRNEFMFASDHFSDK